MNKILLILLIFASFFLPPVYSYDGNSNVFDETAIKGLPVFRYNIFRTLTESGDNFILNIHADISNERLQFQKRDSVFFASYSFSAAVFTGDDTDGIPLYQKSVTNNIVTKEYKETQSNRSYDNHNLKFDMKKGSYTVSLVIKDMNTQKKYTVKKAVEFSDNSDIIISDLRMVYWSNDEDFENTYEPLINNVVDKTSSYTGALFEIVTKDNIPADFSLRYRIRNNEGLAVFDDNFKGVTKDKLQLQVLKIPLENLNAGNYRIDMEINIAKKKIQRNAVFYLRWSDLSLNVTDINSALEQMLYITEYDSLDHVFKMPEDEQKAWFKNYWNELEQSLGLKTNSLMEEYFRRVAYSIMQFSVPLKAGWKTDMGKVLCVMGDPDEVQSYPFAKNQKPYEVWIYYDLGVQYIFDYIGGEYRLRK
ncbi:MAG: GWxTD domain-containing protein [Candidatus Delongbacteria bacterium]|nr:GWxTD domain-containing protein [Candidatus Delongbacteria bacterium]